jgi:hypothetical protein
MRRFDRDPLSCCLFNRMTPDLDVVVGKCCMQKQEFEEIFFFYSFCGMTRTMGSAVYIKSALLVCGAAHYFFISP